MSLSDNAKDEITQAIFAGRKIEAIKLYREATGQGLKEAKAFIEALTDRLREEHPDRVPAPTSGCGAAVLMMLVVPASLLTLWLT